MHTAGRRESLILLISSTLLLAACGSERRVDHAFYEWRSAPAFTAIDRAHFDSLGITRLYIHYFDVQWDEADREPVPQGVASLPAGYPASLEIIPTIYVTSDAMRRLEEPKRIALLAERIVRKVDAMSTGAGLPAWRELQLDCDWTASSRTSYFALLREIRALRPGRVLSATIRLHQVKYRVETGIPPVDRGMLMVYNVGDVVSSEETNSIFRRDEVERYLGTLDDYPLPLDVALPIFSWGVRFHFERFAALIDNVSTADMAAHADFRPLGDNQWQAVRPTRLRGAEIAAGDIVRVEEPDRSDVIEIAERIADDIDQPSLTLSLYRYDPTIIARHGTDHIQDLYRAAR
jgi:hypothetical protein